MTRRLVLHVGCPKTGTSFVQDVLFRNRERLAGHGLRYPADRFDAHFLAALDLMQLTWGGLEREAVGAFDRLAAEVRDWEGTALVSHEILATASPEHVRRALAAFGADTEVHVVLSVRDLARQVPAEWQENVKHRRVVRYRDFLDQIAAPQPRTVLASWFWGVQDVPGILARWGEQLPPEQVHVVTVPQEGAPPTLLWERFVTALGLEDVGLEPVSDRANPSMGSAETAFVRRVNESVNDGVLANEHYRDLVRELLVHRTLSHRPARARLVLPDTHWAWAADLSTRWQQDIAARGYDVVGDLADLTPQRPQVPFTDPDAVTDAELVEIGWEALTAVLVRGGELREEVARLAAELEVARGEVSALTRAKRAVVAREERSPAVAAALRAYRRLRRG